MKNLIVLLMTLGMLVAMQVYAVAAGDEFQIHYQQVEVVSDSGSVSGLVILNVMNTSGGDVTSLLATLTGPNNILYGAQPVLLGDIPSGAEVQIGVPFAAGTDAGSPEAESIWVLTFVDASGVSQEIRVTGRLVQ